MNEKKIVEIKNMTKDYGAKGFRTKVLKGIGFTIFENDFIAIMEPSGSRKICVEKVGKLADLFGLTGHVETVALLSLKNDTPKLEVTMEVTADSNYLPKEKATYQNIKKYVKDNFGVNVHTCYIAEVKRMCGLEMGKTTTSPRKRTRR